MTYKKNFNKKKKIQLLKKNMKKGNMKMRNKLNCMKEFKDFKDLEEKEMELLRKYCDANTNKE
jgi:hypothetical protein